MVFLFTLIRKFESRQKNYGIEYCKTDFDTELGTNGECVIAKMHKNVLKFETGEEQVKHV